MLIHQIRQILYRIVTLTLVSQAGSPSVRQ